MRIEQITPAGADLGESPRWDAADGCLWWVDGVVGDLHRWDASTGVDRHVAVGRRLGGLACRTEGGLAIATDDALLLPRAADLAGPAATRPEDWHRRAVPGRLHDLSVAPDGAIWVGTLASEEDPSSGGLLRIGPAESSPVIPHGLRLPNGIAWTDEGELILADSLAHTVHRVPGDRLAGGLPAPAWLTTDADGGLPDGLTLDRDGGTWIAYWGAGVVRRHDRSGALTDVITVPTSNPTSCTFGGPGLADLFVTTARQHTHGEPAAGAVFRVTGTGRRGVPVPTFTG